MEHFPSASESAPAPTEEVIGEFADAAENYQGSSHTDADRKEAFDLLHTALDKFENHDIKVMYDEGRMPTFDSLERAASAAREALGATNDPEALRIAKLLEGSVKSIKSWCRKYVGSLLRFRNSKMAFLRMNDEEKRDALEQADRDRRRIHDALIGSLASLLDFLKQADEYAKFEQPHEWSPAEALPEGYAAEHPLIFSAKSLGDREEIRDWAIVADRIEELHKLTGLTAAKK